MSRAGHWSNLPSLVRRRLLLPPYHYCRTFFDTKLVCWDPTPNEKVMRFYAQKARATGLFSFPSRRLRGVVSLIGLPCILSLQVVHLRLAAHHRIVVLRCVGYECGTGPAGTTDLMPDAAPKDAMTRRSIMTRETERLHCLTSRNEGSGLTQHNSELPSVD